MSMTRLKKAVGFTLIETLIAVGALLLIALGIARIFDSTGKTVTVGRRVSTMTEYAAMLESRFRDDFSRMTRDGFLIIRNEYANRGVEVALHADGRDVRRRRVDEMMFFMKGRFSSAREAFIEGYPANSNEAAIYYGHGQRRRENFDDNSYYRRPKVYDFNLNVQDLREVMQDQLGFQTAGSPNQYAASWNLTRHVTVLAQPATTVTKIFGTGAGMTQLPSWARDSTWVADGDNQMGLRPAASSLFRALAMIPPLNNSNPSPLYTRGGTPMIASGIVDIATTDLSEIRQIVTTAQSLPYDVTSLAQLDSLLKQGRVSQYVFMQRWMNEAMPSYSMGSRDRSESISRMRSEPSAPDYMQVLGDLRGMANPAASFINSIRRVDQLSVASSVFIPSCTEFIVEWSFGKVDTAGQMIWHGKERRVDLDGNGILDPNEEIARPYEGSSDDFVTIPLQTRGTRGRTRGTTGGANAPVGPFGMDDWHVNPRLIHGDNPGTPAFDSPLTSYFGYYDPTFNPDKRDAGGRPISNADAFDRADALSPTIPWAWPEVIRITLTLADPIDPTIEQSFQFVFDAPGNPVY